MGLLEQQDLHRCVPGPEETRVPAVAAGHLGAVRVDDEPHERIRGLVWTCQSAAVRQDADVLVAHTRTTPQEAVRNRAGPGGAGVRPELDYGVGTLALASQSTRREGSSGRVHR